MGNVGGGCKCGRGVFWVPFPVWFPAGLGYHRAWMKSEVKARYTRPKLGFAPMAIWAERDWIAGRGRCRRRTSGRSAAEIPNLGAGQKYRFGLRIQTRTLCPSGMLLFDGVISIGNRPCGVTSPPMSCDIVPPSTGDFGSSPLEGDVWEGIIEGRRSCG